MSPRKAFEYLNRITGLAPMGAPVFEGADPILPTPFHAAEAAAASLGLSASTAAEIWRLRGGDKQEIALDLNAAAGSLLSRMIAGAETPEAEVFRPSRVKPVASARRAVKESVDVAWHWMADRVVRAERTASASTPSAPASARPPHHDGE